ncbi:MAG: hypothetical protein OXF40_12540, partial [Rhodospirillales bacterium]|nr:hypothetical protein [Rhodospirillales bacterium]
TVVARRGPATGVRSELHVVPRGPAPGFGTRLSERLAAWGAERPGLSQRLSALGREIVIPAALHTPHEAHFPMVLDDFLDLLDSGDWPAVLAARIRSRYVLLARAQESCAAGCD